MALDISDIFSILIDPCFICSYLNKHFTMMNHAINNSISITGSQENAFLTFSLLQSMLNFVPQELGPTTSCLSLCHSAHFSANTETQKPTFPVPDLDKERP